MCNDLVLWQKKNPRQFPTEGSVLTHQATTLQMSSVGSVVIEATSFAGALTNDPDRSYCFCVSIDEAADSHPVVAWGYLVCAGVRLLCD